MSERKVLNKYYPPDFDPSKIPRMKLAKNRQYTVRLMAPFNMRCATCGEYIYKGKKFNARKEDVENEDYLGIRIYRFYIKCTRCLQEISFKTDPKNTDYEIEAGATRNFMALKLAEEQAKREEDEQKEEEANNPMKLLEYRTEQSRQEIERLEGLEELKELNRRQQAVDYEGMLQQYKPESAEARRAREEKEDDDFIKSIKFSGTSKVVAEEIIEDVEEQDEPPAKTSRIETVTVPAKQARNETWNRSIGVKKPALANLVKSKNVSKTASTKESSVNTVSTASDNTDDKSSVSSTASENVVPSAKASENVVTSAKASENVVTSAKASENVVTSAKASENVVTSAKASENVVTSAKASENVVTSAKASENVVTSAKTSESVTPATSGLTLLANYSGSDSDSQ